MVSVPVFERAFAAFASIIKPALVPLSITILLKAVAELPLMILFVAPLKLTVSVNEPALNTPLFVQSPYMLR
jgi:hypothetical protein